MNIEEFREFVLSLPYVEETTPFDETTLVYKIGGKMFTFADMIEFKEIAVKCDPDKAIELRERYSEITPAYHMSKKHWNGISTSGSLTDAQIKQWIVDSYKLVYDKLPKKIKDLLI